MTPFVVLAMDWVWFDLVGLGWCVVSCCDRGEGRGSPFEVEGVSCLSVFWDREEVICCVGEVGEGGGGFQARMRLRRRLYR